MGSVCTSASSSEVTVVEKKTEQVSVKPKPLEKVEEEEERETDTTAGAAKEAAAAAAAADTERPELIGTPSEPVADRYRRVREVGLGDEPRSPHYSGSQSTLRPLQPPPPLPVNA
jgi:hypothetical protein